MVSALRANFSFENILVMKKALFLIIVIFGLSFMSCNQTDTREATTTVVKNTTTTITEPGTDGFLLKKQVVVHGNTVWGFTQKVYGTGTNWRDVVAQNPFLQQPGRVYYDDVKKMWIVLIYPGEVLKLGSEVISPTYVVEESTTTTTVTKPALIPWWEWALIITAIVAFLLIIIRLLWPGLVSSSSSNSSANVRVNINNPGCFDIAVQRAILERRQSMQQDLVSTIVKGADKGTLKDFCMIETADAFMTAGSFRKGCSQTTELKKEDQK